MCSYQPEVASRVRVVGNGIEDGRKASQAHRKRCPEDDKLILYSGRLVERKGIAELFSAIPTVLEEAHTAKFVVVGGYGTGPEIAERFLGDALRSYSDRIHFTGWLAPEGVVAWYRRAPILVVPSWYEPFGMVILEGMLYGMAIAASNVGGPAEIIEHERTGILFPPKDSSAVADSLLRLINIPGLRNRLGRAAAKEVRAKWLWGSIIEKMRAVYSGVAFGGTRQVVGSVEG